MFRKANRYPVEASIEQAVLKAEPQEGIGKLVHRQLKAMQEKQNSIAVKNVMAANDTSASRK